MLLLLFPILCLSNFAVYYSDNDIFVDDSNCSNKFEVAYNSSTHASTHAFTTETMKITFNGTIANISSNNDTYTFIYKQNNHSSDLIFNIFSSVFIYKNNDIVGTSSVRDNNIEISSPSGGILYYINQISQNLLCPLSNKYSYTGILMENNTIIPEDIMATGIGVLLPFMALSPVSTSKKYTAATIVLTTLFLTVIVIFLLIVVTKCRERKK